MTTKLETALDHALWANSVQRLCLLECDGDVDAALSAATHIVDTQTPDTFTPEVSDPHPKPINAYFAHDIANKRAQGILNRSTQRTRQMSATARADLGKAVRKSKTDSGAAIVKFIDKYRKELVNVLAQTQLASVLEGAKQVASKVPVLDADQAALARTLGAISQPDFQVEDGAHSAAINKSARDLSLKGALSKQEYEILDQQTRSKAVAVAGAEAEQVLSKIRDAYSSGVSKRTDYEALEQEVLQAVDKGTFMSDAHMGTLLRANVQTAFSDGQVQVLTNPLVRDRFPYAAYKSFRDDRAREQHNHLDGAGIQGSNVYRTDDPVFQVFRPPWDYNCRCTWTPLTVSQAATQGVSEAQRWLDTGRAPNTPNHVSMPAFSPPEAFERSLGAAPLSIRLSMQSISMYDSAVNDPVGAPAPPGPPFPVEQYPRNNANQFVPKVDIARAARDEKYREELIASLPQEERGKLESAILHLQTGGIVHHPSEHPGLGVGLHGYVADYRWDNYQRHLEERTKWEKRDALRKEQLKAAKEAVRKMRYKNPELDEVRDNLSRAGATDAELRLLSRVLAKSKRPDADRYEHLDAYEDVAESVFKRLEEIDPEPSVPEQPSDTHGPYFGMVGDEWHGPTPPGQNWVAIAPGPKGGKRWKKSQAQTGVSDGRPKGSGIPDIGGAGRPDVSGADAPGGRVGGQAGRPEGQGTGGQGQAARQPASSQADSAAPVKKTGSQRVYKRVGEYADFFGKRGDREVAEWMNLLKEHIQTVGKEVAERQLREERGGTTPTEKVQYTSTAYFDDGDYDLEWLKDYLDHVGIVFQPGEERIGDMKRVATAPIASVRDGMRRGDIVATESNLYNKLVEAQALPGLESSEDIHEIIGHKVTNFTPDVLKKLDARYGRGKWVVKPYGNEAYAGFGVFFPHRVTEIQRSSKEVLWGVSKRLKPLGYTLARDENKRVVGISDSAGRVYKFGTLDLASIKDKRVRQDANVAAAAAPTEIGARLPMTPEEGIAQDYGILLRRGEDGKVVGITDGDGKNLDVGTRAYNALVYDEYSGIGTAIERAITSVEAGDEGDDRFMVQPAFQAVGVSQYDRALGMTWENSTEGRVHVSTMNGKASVVPYATIAYRGDSFPVVFYDDDTRAMEKAVQEAIDALPESERNGQTYAPDVLKTKDGWKVIELNASTPGGQSLWFEENPFVIDAYLSNLSGRDPAHVRFIRDIVRGNAKDQRSADVGAGTVDTDDITPDTSVLRGKVGRTVDASNVSAPFATDDQGHEHAPAGSGKGGQFVSKGQGGTETAEETKVEKRERRAKQAQARKSTGLKVGEAVRSITSAVSKSAEELLTGKPQKVSVQVHKATVKKAMAKYEINPEPTPDEVKENLAGLERLGANKYRRGLVGNSTDRKARRVKLLKEFGDGNTCPCIYCGVVLGHGTMEQDKMYTTAQGGRYRQVNLVPACKACNNLRGDMTWIEAIDKVVRFVRPDSRPADEE